ncbi:MAG: apocarotenoid-15,15'-oxygenase [Variovorax paradoxus]|uniref:Apocarotenoid-15,15'-oxygenase n=1 Tax=Variovorax paradoxus TaxID=34073 RepID=A0A2W5S5S6_VARPD|nr:MAG: apocarotenoid-15,15'-oxygenase [Variovorax paradoxus]
MGKNDLQSLQGDDGFELPVLQGGFEPVEQELDCELTEIEGEVPADLNGIYVRNGPNRRFAAKGRYHWFDGDGMLHAVRFDRGRVYYQNRWVRTDGLTEELSAGGALWQGIKDPPRRDRPDMPLKNTSNTDVKYFAGSLVSMWYLGGTVYQVRPDDLATVGKLEFDERLRGLPVSAHSKVDERTGEFLFFAYGKEAPYMHYGVMGRDGKLKTLMPVQLPGPRLPHDMAFTPNYTILHDFPLFYDMEAFAAGRHKLKFHHTLPSRFAIVPRHGKPEQIRWFDASPTYMYHVSNAWEESDDQGGTEIVMTGTPFRLPRDWRGNVEVDRFPKMLANLEHDFIFMEWRFNLRTGQTRERVIDDIVNQEFPVINSWMQGYKTRYSWNVLMGRSNRAEDPRFCGLVRYDLEKNTCAAYHEGPDKWFSEAPFAPKDNWKEEDDGYLVGFMWDGAAKSSSVVVFDARDVARGPVARIRLPQRVPNGFHATWVSAERLARGW